MCGSSFVFWNEATFLYQFLWINELGLDYFRNISGQAIS